MNISTSLICCDLSNISKDLDIIVEHEGFNWLHADFMDGHFVPSYGYQSLHDYHSVYEVPELTQVICHNEVRNAHP